MLAVILPTAEIIHHYERSHGELFTFLDGGLKELVRRLVCVSSGWYYNHFTDLQKSEESNRLTSELVEMYEISLHRRYLENTHHQLNVSVYIENVIHEIEDTINKMMNYYFVDIPYKVHSTAGWLSNELVAYMTPIGYGHEQPTPEYRSLF